MTQVTHTNYSHLALRTESPLHTTTNAKGETVVGVFDRLEIKPDRFLRLIHSALGLSSESAELAESYCDARHHAQDVVKQWSNTLGELGDLWWFVNAGYRGLNSEVNYASICNVVVEDYQGLSFRALYEDLNEKIASFQDHIKAHLFYGREEFKLPPDLKLSATAILSADLNAISVILSFITSRVTLDATTCVEFEAYANLTREQAVLKIMEANIAKLRARYPDAYSDISANARDETAELKAIVDAKS